MSSPRVADTLAEAGPRDLVNLDRKGRVRTRAQTWALVGGYWGILGSLVAVEGYLGYLLLGMPGLSIAAVLGGYVGWIFTRVTHLRRATRMLVTNQLEEAEAAYLRVAQSRFTPRHLKARAWGGLASAARLRGEDELALERVRKAIALQRRKRPLGLTARHMEAAVLARLGRLQESRAVWRELPQDIPDGEYVKLSHHTTELYLAFCEGSHGFDDDALHERASFALEITAAAPLLALLGWAFEQNGDTEMATLLVDEARDRHPGELMSVPMPEVSGWLEGYGRVRVDDSVAAEANRPAFDELELDSPSGRRNRREPS